VKSSFPRHQGNWIVIACGANLTELDSANRHFECRVRHRSAAADDLEPVPLDRGGPLNSDVVGKLGFHHSSIVRTRNADSRTGTGWAIQQGRFNPCKMTFGPEKGAVKHEPGDEGKLVNTAPDPFAGEQRQRANLGLSFDQRPHSAGIRMSTNRKGRVDVVVVVQRQAHCSNCFLPLGSHRRSRAVNCCNSQRNQDCDDRITTKSSINVNPNLRNNPVFMMDSLGIRTRMGKELPFVLHER